VTARQSAWVVGAAMLAVYIATSAPGVTFWDSGEFIAAARTLGVPHPPGTPLFVLLLSVWARLLSFLPYPVATNLFSAVCTAGAAGLTVVWMARGRTLAIGASAAAALCAGAMASVWQNATETEVYAASLALAIATIVCADRFGRSGESRWLVLTAYLLALAIPLHASALVAAPVVIYLAAARAGAQPSRRAYDWPAGVAIAGAAVCAIGLSRLSAWTMGMGAALIVAAAFLPGWGERQVRAGTAVAMLIAIGVAFSLLTFMLLRARHDPAINQGNPSTWSTLAAVIGRRQYDVQGLWPREAPLWLQVANWFEYADWQFGLSLGPTVIPTPARVVVTLAFGALGLVGARWHRRTDRRTWSAVLLLFLCGSLGVLVYLNLKAGASFGWQFVPSELRHEARERDYFFVLGFWAWGIWAGMGAMALSRRLSLPRWIGVAGAALPIALNWPAVTRRSQPGASLPGEVARALLGELPPRAVLFVDGDNDTYPVWYAQQVERLRPDVTVITLPLLAARWYVNELARRDSLIPAERGSTGRVSLGEIAGMAARQGRPVAATVTIPAEQRRTIGAGWKLAGAVFVASAVVDPAGDASRDSLVAIDSAATRAAAVSIESWRKGRDVRPSLDPVNEYFLNVLSCPRLALLPTPSRAQLVSLDSTCNLR
jgi:Protein O-mannosyl-transferase TMEM260-like